MKKRESGLELMRIVGMLMIIAYHYFIHGGYTSEQLYSYQWPSLYISMLGAFGRMACGAFALTTGYFLIDYEGMHHYRRIIPVVVEMTFYSLAVLVSAIIFQFREVSLAECVKSLLPLVYGNWYVVNYILICLLAPFLNLGLKQMAEKTYSLFSFIVLLIWSFIPTVAPAGWSFSHLDFFLAMYIIGGGLKASLGKENTLAQSLELCVVGGVNVICLALYGIGQWHWSFDKCSLDSRKSITFLCI